MLHTQLAALALTAATLAASGCGGSSKTESTTSAASATTPATTASTKTASGTALTRAELIAKAEPICARANAELSSTTVRSGSEFARALPQAAAYERAEATELSKLAPPGTMAVDWEQIVAGIRAFAEDTAKVGEYIQSKNPTAATTLYAAAKKDHEHVAAIFKGDGFKECAAV
jgi:hypothetical protein